MLSRRLYKIITLLVTVCKKRERLERDEFYLRRVWAGNSCKLGILLMASASMLYSVEMRVGVYSTLQKVFVFLLAHLARGPAMCEKWR